MNIYMHKNPNFKSSTSIYIYIYLGLIRKCTCINPTSKQRGIYKNENEVGQLEDKGN